MNGFGIVTDSIQWDTKLIVRVFMVGFLITAMLYILFKGLQQVKLKKYGTQCTPTSPTSWTWQEIFHKIYLKRKIFGCGKHTKYDLVSAVKRQSPFYYQVPRPHMDNQHFLEGIKARYKGFLYLIKRNRERSIKCLCVPTYDTDLIWHSHQMHPVSYCKDLCKLVGKVLEHDDMDSDRTKGKSQILGFQKLPSSGMRHLVHVTGKQEQCIETVFPLFLWPLLTHPMWWPRR